MINHLSGVSAYNKALQAHHKIKASQHENIAAIRGILKKGDDFSLVSKPTNIPENDFSAVLKNTMLKNPLNSIHKVSDSLRAISSSDAQDIKFDTIELMESINEAQLTLNAVLAVRDSFIDAYKAILNMSI